MDWDHRAGDKVMVMQRTQFVGIGYLPLYRYNPGRVGKGSVKPFGLDNKCINDQAMSTMPLRG